MRYANIPAGWPVYVAWPVDTQSLRAASKQGTAPRCVAPLLLNQQQQLVVNVNKRAACGDAERPPGRRTHRRHRPQTHPSRAPATLWAGPGMTLALTKRARRGSAYTKTSAPPPPYSPPTTHKTHGPCWQLAALSEKCEPAHVELRAHGACGGGERGCGRLVWKSGKRDPNFRTCVVSRAGLAPRGESTPGPALGSVHTASTYSRAQAAAAGSSKVGTR